MFLSYTNCRTTREEQGDESDEFILYFDGDIEVLEGGSESGFFQVEETIYIKRLFKCHGQNNILLEPVESHVDSIGECSYFPAYGISPVPVFRTELKNIVTFGIDRRMF